MKTKKVQPQEEKPVRVIPNKWSREHKTETRIFAREIHESFCIQPGCKFKGRNSQQGICHTREPMVEGTSWTYMEKVEKWAEDALKEARKLYRKKGPKEYIRYLESAHVCDTMNSVFMLDGLILLRRKLALLEPKA